MKKFKCIILTLIFPILVIAGNESGGGGGDNFEAKVEEIRVDIRSWIEKGGAKELKLPKDIELSKYEEKMLEILASKKVIITFVTTAEEEQAKADNNPELQVTVGRMKKTCRGFESTFDQSKNILCNIERFALVEEADRYPLIHHEYAGLVRLEKNIGAASDYQISNQLTGFLVQQTVLKLSLKKYSYQACGLSGPIEDRKKDCRHLQNPNTDKDTTLVTALNDGSRVLYDSRKKIFWTTPSKSVLNFRQAKNYCKSLKFLNTKWDLPSKSTLSKFISRTYTEQEGYEVGSSFWTVSKTLKGIGSLFEIVWVVSEGDNPNAQGGGYNRYTLREIRYGTFKATPSSQFTKHYAICVARINK